MMKLKKISTIAHVVILYNFYIYDNNLENIESRIDRKLSQKAISSIHFKLGRDSYFKS